MKKIIYLISFCTLLACSNDFLELYPKSTLNEGNFYKSQAEFILLANGCYIPMRDYEKNLHWVMAELISDNTSFQYTTVSGEPSRGVIDQFVSTSNNRAYANFWDLSYQGITRCNKLLSEINRPDVTWANEAFKDRSTGEALFLRALYYFNLVRQFGGVPLVLNPITSQEAAGIKRSLEEEVYVSIVSDLNEAASHFSRAEDVEENGRANWGAATALLGKVHMTLHNYEEAELVLAAVINSGKYILLPNYADLFDPTNKDFQETIFAIQYSENSVELSHRFVFIFAPSTSGGDVTQRPNINITGAGYGWNQPTEDLINAFEPNDMRKDASIGFWLGEDWDKEVRNIPYQAKFRPPVSAPDRAGDNLPVIRYSDVLLMYAEALNELGRTDEAIPYVYQVRSRAGLTDPLSGYDKTGLQALIAKERQVEFCFENQRWYDLKRTGKALEVMAAHGSREKANKEFLLPSSFEMAPYKLINPIPSEQILINGLDQNAGY